MQAILASRPFLTATRARRFLTHIVEQTLAGKTDGIKELVLGIEVFDRPADFDPKTDPIVRVEAGRLRKRLDDYYADEGKDAHVLIEVATGTYIPQFQFRTQVAAPEIPAATEVSHRKDQVILRYAAALGTLLCIVGFGWWGTGRWRTPAEKPSIAVLPFLNLSADASNEYFADGLAEELTDALCNAGGLRVASRTSAFFFKGKQVDIHEIGSKLNVGFVVEGSVRKQGDQLKVTAQLIRIEDGYHVWSGSFERRQADVFAVQQELASSVVKALQIKLSGAQSRRLKKAHTANKQAFDLYLQGKYAMNSVSPGDMARAESFFQQSVAADPDYAIAYVALAQIYVIANIAAKRPASETFQKASVAIKKALALDDELAEAHSSLGSLTARHLYDWATAESHLRRALELNPNSATAHNDLAQNVLAPQGRWREALAEYRLASELDPISPIIASGGPFLESLQRHTEAAEEGARKLAAGPPPNFMALQGVASALMQKGDYQGALEISRRIYSRIPTKMNLAVIGYLLARSGNQAEARKILIQFQADKEYVSPVCFAFVYIGLADVDGAFRYLELAREQQESFLIFARVAPIYDPIRGDPRFATLLRKVGLSDEQLKKNQ